MSKGQLNVIVVEAKDLKDQDILGRSDPYIELWLEKKYKQRTTHKSNTLQPLWNEDFQFKVDGETTLHICALDKDILSDDEIGEGKVKLDEVYSKGYIDVWVKLPTMFGLRSNGQVHLIIEFKPE